MGLIHTPRVVYSLIKGLWFPGKTSTSVTGQLVGFGSYPPHHYRARAGLWDVDYLGHMNNAAYLSHAEYARWEWSAANGMLSAMLRHQTHFMVTSTALRFRREIRPLFRQFGVESSFIGLDERHLWILHNFRHEHSDERGGGGKAAKSVNGDSKDRIRAQVIVKAVVVQGRNVMAPREFFQHIMKLPAELIDQLDELKFDPSTQFSTEEEERDDPADLDRAHPTSTALKDLMKSFDVLDDSFKQLAKVDDETMTHPAR